MEKLGILLRRRALSWYRLKLDAATTLPPPPGITLDIGPVATMNNWPGGWLTPEQAMDVQCHATLFAARHEGRIIAYNFIYTREAPIRFYDLTFGMTENMAYFAHGYVAPEYRRQQLSLALRRFTAAHMSDRYRWMISCADPRNTALHRIMALLGAERFARTGYLRVGPVRSYSFTLGGVTEFTSDPNTLVRWIINSAEGMAIESSVNTHIKTDYDSTPIAAKGRTPSSPFHK